MISLGPWKPRKRRMSPGAIFTKVDRGCRADRRFMSLGCSHLAWESLCPPVGTEKDEKDVIGWGVKGALAEFQVVDSSRWWRAWPSPRLAVG